MLTEMLGLTAFGLSDDAFCDLVRTQIQALLAAQSRLRQFEGRHAATEIGAAVGGQSVPLQHSLSGSD